MRNGIKNGALIALTIVTLAFIALAAVNPDAIYAQTPTEDAVINCGDSASGHGGSADNPPKCIDEDGQEVDAVTIVVAAVGPAPQQAPTNLTSGEGWVTLHELESDKLCIETVESIGVRAVNEVQIDGQVVATETDEPVDDSTRKHCISYTTVIEATHSLNVTITRE